MQNLITNSPNMIARSRKRETVGYDLRCCRCMSCRWTLGPRGTPLFQHYSHLLSWNGALPATPIVFAFLFENPKKEALATEKRDKKRGLYYIWNRILWTTQYSTWSFRQEDSPLTNKRSTCCNAGMLPYRVIATLNAGSLCVTVQSPYMPNLVW